eukprot:Colp12_sorted_trinity150504_noHs@11063
MAAVPHTNMALLRKLFRVVAEVVVNENVTEMNAENMAICLTGLVFNFEKKHLITDELGKKSRVKLEAAKELLKFIIEEQSFIIQDTDSKVANEIHMCEAWNAMVHAHNERKRESQWWRRFLPWSSVNNEPRRDSNRRLTVEDDAE